MKRFLKRVVSRAVVVLKREPVTVWGVVIAAAVGVVSTVTGYDVAAAVGVILPLVGIPVVRRKVSPVDAAKALIDGAKPSTG